MYTGLTGKVTIDGKDVAYISNWSVEDTTDIIEITTLGDVNKKKLAGPQSWSASAEGAVCFNEATHLELFSAKKAGKEVSVAFFLDGNTKFLGKGFIESLSVDLSAEDKGNISISISGNGALGLSKGAVSTDPPTTTE
jgi:predicted secreted protein